MTKLLLIDGSSLLHRAFFALPLLSNSSGVFTNAVHGFMMMFNRLTAASKPDHVAVCFDKSRHTFRSDLYDEYKAGRAETPNELRDQFELIKEVLEAAGVYWLEQEGYEADDLLGTLSRRGAEQGFQVEIVSGDRDIFQLVDEHTTVLWTKKGISETELVDVAYIQAKYGLTPPRLADLKGLMGDASDHIPGVPGVGEKTAIKLLAAYGDLDNLYTHVAEVKGKLGEKLIAHRDLAFLSRRLATICREVPLDIEWPELCYDPHRDLSALSALYGRLGLRQLQRTVEATAKSADKSADKAGAKEAEIFSADRPWPDADRPQSTPAAEAAANTDPTAASVPENAPEKASDAVSALSPSLPSLPADCCLLLYQGGELTVCPPGGQPQPLTAPSDLRALLEDAAVPKLTFDAKEIYKALSASGVTLRGLRDDALIAAYLIDPSRGEYRLEDLLAEHSLADIPAAYALPALIDRQRELLSRRQMLSLYTELELPLTGVLARMELQGIRCDEARLRKMSAELSDNIEEIQARIFAQAGHEFNLNSPKQLGTVLFEELGIPPLKKTRSGYSTDAEVMETLALTQPLCRDILDYRLVAKLRSTYTEGLARLVGADGRIHTCFKQTVTATGRLSSVEPNLQNIPVRQEQGRRIRRVFMADTPADWLLAADYSQIELRVLAHVAGDNKLRQAYLDGEDIHARTASEVLGVPREAVTPEQRRAAKAVNFGIVYGISDYGLSKDLGISRREARDYMDTYFARYPQVAAYQRQIILEARRQGYVETVFGRRRYLPELASRNFNLRSFAERVAMNAPIQGTAADIIKLAMIAIDREIQERGLRSRMLLQVHDELIFNVPDGELELMKGLVRQHMEQAVELSVPLTVEVKIGHDWYAMEVQNA